MRISIASTFGAWPPIDGASLRNFHLYRHVARVHPVELVSAVHPARGELDAVVAPGLRERRIAVSEGFLAAAAGLSARLGGAPVTDLAMARFHSMTPRFVAALRESCARADVVVASHPYLVYALREVCDKPLVYEAPDVEVDLKEAVLPDSAEGRELLSLVALAEADCCRQAALVLACTDADRERLIALYGLDPGRVRVARNGADIDGIAFVDWPQRRQASGTRPPSALFLGSWHGPNVQAARALAGVAQALPQVRVVIAGSVCGDLRAERFPANVHLAGMLDEAGKQALLRESDVALNPVQSGSGSNVKLPEYCAAGLPAVTTGFGNRGTGLRDGEHVYLRDLADFPAAIAAILDATNAAATTARVARARDYIERCLSWRDAGAETIASLERVLAVPRRATATPRLASFVIPMLDAAPFIAECLESVLAQSHRELEVLVVDDGCTDGSPEIVRQFAQRDPRVRQLSHPGAANRGVGRSLELALSHARGTRIALIDADDVHEPGKLGQQMAAMDRHPEAVLCHSAVTLIGDVDSIRGRATEAHFAGFAADEPYRYFDRADSLSSCRILNSTALVDTAAMRAVAFPAPQRFQTQDWLLFALLAERGPFIYLPQKLARYRIHRDSYTSRSVSGPLDRAYGHLEFLITLQTRVQDAALLDPIERGIAARIGDLAAIYAEHGLRRQQAPEVVPSPAKFCAPISIRLLDRSPADVKRRGEVQVELHNRGDYLLASHRDLATMLSYHWLDARTGAVVVWDGIRSRLAPALRPGGKQAYSMLVEWPAQMARGDSLLLRVTPVLEGCFWFDQHSACYADLLMPPAA